MINKPVTVDDLLKDRDFLQRVMQENARLRQDPLHTIAQELPALRAAIEQIAKELLTLRESIENIVERL